MHARDAASRCRGRRGSRAAPARCRPRRRGRAARRRRRRARARAAARRGRGRRRSPTTSWPSRSSASSTRAPERSETWRSSERPPLRTATRSAASRGARARAWRARQVQHVGELRVGRRAAPARPPAPAGCAGERAEQLDLLARRPRRCGARPRGCRRSSTPEKFSRIDEPPRPSRYAARPGHERDVATAARAPAGRSCRCSRAASPRRTGRPAGRVQRRLGREVLGERVEHRVAAARGRARAATRT